MLRVALSSSSRSASAFIFILRLEEAEEIIFFLRFEEAAEAFGFGLELMVGVWMDEHKSALRCAGDSYLFDLFYLFYLFPIKNR
jgi:hypothetical protein